MAIELGMYHCVPKTYKDCSNDDLDLFYGKVKYGQSYTYDFMESFEDFCLKIGNKICLNEYM